MEANRDTLSDAERARRYRARLRGEDVPMGKPGRRPRPEQTHTDRARMAAGELCYELGWLVPEDVDKDDTLGIFLELLDTQIGRLGRRDDWRHD
jgi:hypothetical protein